MDVKCQHCGVEYEFDDDRITPEGVTVKCTACGHIFKVKREVRVVTEPVQDAQKIGSDWMVRQPSGNVFTFKELTTLQRWIVERKVARSDEISRTGKTWKRLGDIAELASFFQVVDDASGRSFTDVQNLIAAQPEINPAALGGADQAAAPQPQAMQIHYTNPGTEIPVQLQQAPQGPAVEPSAAPLSAPGPAAAVTQPEQPAVQGGWNPPVEAPLAVTTPPSWSDAAADDLLDDEDPVREWRRRRRWPLVLLVLILLVAGGGVGVRLAAPQTFDDLLGQLGQLFSKPLPPGVQAAVDRARAAATRGTLVGLEAAVAPCQGAIAEAPGSAEPFAALALVQVSLAEAGDERYRNTKARYSALLKSFPDGFGEDAEAQKQATELSQRATAVQEKAREHFKRAADAVREALTIAPKSPLALLAAADYARAVGKNDQAQTHLAGFPADAPDPDGLKGLIELELELGRGKPTPAALDALSAHVARHPDHARARYRLVLARARGGDLEAAKKEAEALLASVADHERVKAWLKAQQPEPAVEPEPEPEPEPKKRELGFDALVAKGDRLRDRGQFDRAFDYFTKAAGLEPQRAEPRAGMGWCYLDMGKTSAAISSFQSALDVNARYADAHMGLAESARARGAKAQALKHYQSYLEILPSGSEASVARRWVEQLATE